MKYKYLTSVFSILIIFSIGSFSVLSKDKESSDLEGRKLQEVPIKKTMIKANYSEKKYNDDIKNGELFKTWDKYFSDHIIGRSTMVNAYTKIQGTLNKKLINGVYIGKDDYIFSKETIQETNDNEIKKSAEYFNNFAKELDESKLYMLSVPHKIMAYENKMPIEGYVTKGNKYSDLFLENIDNNLITALDYRDLINGDDELFYKTDHHWNIDGAYKGYKYIIESIKKDFNNITEPLDKEKFNKKIYPDIFLGSDGRKISSIREDLDSIEIYKSDALNDCKIYYQDKERKFIYEDAISKERLNNDYLAYLRGDFPKLVTKNEKSGNDLKVVLIGDSMDNILLPFLTPHFKEIYNYDLRKYKGDIKEEMKDINPDIVLMVGLTNNYILGDKGNVFKF